MTDMSRTADLIRNVTQTADLIRNITQKTQEYNTRVLEFAAANSNATLEYLSKLASTKSPSEIIELTTRYVHEQSEVLARQARELTEMTQKLLPRSSS
jgi:hypothetical protein